MLSPAKITRLVDAKTEELMISIGKPGDSPVRTVAELHVLYHEAILATGISQGEIDQIETFVTAYYTQKAKEEKRRGGK